MHLRRLTIRNLRSIRQVELDFTGMEAGWHVILGTNGAGKSSVIRAFALLAMGEREAYAARQDFSRWLRSGEHEAVIEGTFAMHQDVDRVAGSGRTSAADITAQVTLTRTAEAGRAAAVEAGFGPKGRAERTIWGGGFGWFSSSFGPFRRFTGGDRVYDRLFVSNRRLAPHLTALGEDVALNEALAWLSFLHVTALQEERGGSETPPRSRDLLNRLIGFVNASGFLPHGALIHEVTNEAVLVRDGNGIVVPVDQLSDGYRSALCIAVELLRQMHVLHEASTFLDAVDVGRGLVTLPGVVAIDEVDAHLHPTWQRDIGRWLTRAFPQVQFLVTTHSPIVCRAVADDEGVTRGSIWRLPSPGSAGELRRIEDVELGQLIFGDVLDAFGTELFGHDMARSEAGKSKVARLAALNRKALDEGLGDSEKAERRLLRAALPAEAGRLGAD
jgi:predicted ATPase